MRNDKCTLGNLDIRELRRLATDRGLVPDRLWLYTIPSSILIQMLLAYFHELPKADRPSYARQ